MRRDEQQGGIGRIAFDLVVDRLQRLGIIVVFLHVEVFVILILDLFLVLLPDRFHGVDCFKLIDFLGLAVFFVVVAFDHHLDRIADEIGILFDEVFDLKCFKIRIVFLFLGVFLDVKGDRRAAFFLLSRQDLVAVHIRTPFVGLFFIDLFRKDFDFVGNHEGGIEAYTELSDDICFTFFIKLFLEFEGTGFCDRSQVVFKLLSIHADAVIRNGDDPVWLIDVDMDLRIIEADARISQRQDVSLIEGIGCVGDQFSQEDIGIGINRVGHHVQ